MVPTPGRGQALSLLEGSGRLRRERLTSARLYFICDARPEGEDPEPLLRAALDGGAQIVQLREKELDDRALLRSAATFRRLAEGFGALFILNDRPDLARAAGADGVHIGQEDGNLSEAREIIGPEAIIGLSTHTPEQLDSAGEMGLADYVSAGPIWETPTKPGRPATGLDLISHAAEHASMPFFAIGGIDQSNVGEVTKAGATRIAIVRAIRDADDPRAAAAALRAALDHGAS
jgi:thiamine-phosphate pyrophosphorylase